MIYKKPTNKGCLASVIIWAIIGIILGSFLGLFLTSPIGLLIGAGIGLLLGLGQAGKNFAEKEKEYEETQKFVMQKVQTGVPLSKAEQELWDSMNAK